uniref:Putative secreted protein n=1 Tax=Amblyomma triste TaxID=251400 RepID=A0A023G494_AMBTT
MLALNYICAILLSFHFVYNCNSSQGINCSSEATRSLQVYALRRDPKQTQNHKGDYSYISTENCIKLLKAKLCTETSVPLSMYHLLLHTIKMKSVMEGEILQLTVLRHVNAY